MSARLTAGTRSDTARFLFSALGVPSVTLLPAFLLGALAVQVSASLSLEPSFVGVAVGGYFGTAALVSAFAGRAVDRFGWLVGMRVASSGAALVLASLAVFGTGRASIVILLACGGAFFALGHPAVNRSLSTVVPQPRQGLAFGLKQSAVPVATLVSGVAVPVVALRAGWRWAFALGAAAAVLVAISIRPIPGPNTEPEHRPRAFRVGQLIGLAGIGGVASVAAASLSAFLVLSMVATGLAEGTAGLVLAGASIGGVLTRVLAGWAVDRREAARGFDAVAWMLTVGSTGFVLLASGNVALVTIGAVVAFAGSWGWAGIYQWAVVYNSGGFPGHATGVTQAGIYLGAALGTPILGLVASAASFAAVWIVCAGASLCAAAGMLVVSRLARRDAD